LGGAADAVTAGALFDRTESYLLALIRFAFTQTIGAAGALGCVPFRAEPKLQVLTSTQS
jgi:hypothetical protein